MVKQSYNSLTVIHNNHPVTNDTKVCFGLRFPESHSIATQKPLHATCFLVIDFCQVIVFVPDIVFAQCSDSRFWFVYWICRILKSCSTTSASVSLVCLKHTSLEIMMLVLNKCVPWRLSWILIQKSCNNSVNYQDKRSGPFFSDLSSVSNICSVKPNQVKHINFLFNK